MFTRNPAKLEARAQGYEARGKVAKALKYRQKAARLTGGQMGGIAPLGAAPLTGTTFTPVEVAPLGGPYIPTRSRTAYETNALKWERRGNYTKAQKNRGKVWRLQNPQYANVAPPQLYQNNQFLGYDVAYTPVTHNVMPTTVEHIVRPTVIEQTMRPERVVEVQPIVHREIEAPQVKIVERHTYETVPASGPSTITNAPIVQETVIPKIIEEVQPIIHREVPAPFVERVEQHVTEHIVNPTITTKEVINDGTQVTAPMGFAAGGPAPPQATTTNTATTQKTGLMGKVQNLLHHNQNTATSTTTTH